MHETFLYRPDGTLTTGLNIKDMDIALKEEGAVLWVDICDTDDADIGIMTNIFKLHALTVEDCILPMARPKIEKFSHYFFINMFDIELQAGKHKEVGVVEMDCCLGKNFLITVHADPVKCLATIKERVRKQSPIMKQGADFLLCSIIDAMVDSYFPIISFFDNKVDEVSDELFKEELHRATLSKIYRLKTSLMYLRRTLGPQMDALSMLLRGDYEFIQAVNLAYFRNIYDHMVRLIDMLNFSRDIVTSALEAYNSVINNRLNEIMKTLTVIATIMMPLTLIASVYGMNFKHMPELNSKFGYPFALGIMFFISAVMLVYFKRRKWL